MKMDPIHQFEIHNLFKIGQIGDHAVLEASNWFPAACRRWPN